MDTIGHGSNWHFVFGKIRPNDLPHASRDTTMKVTDSVSPTGHSQRQHCHIEGIAKLTQVHELLLRQAQFVPITGEMFLHHMEWKCVVACGHGRVRSEDAARSDLFCCLFKRLAGLDEFSGSFHQHEGGVAFICMKDAGLYS